MNGPSPVRCKVIHCFLPLGKGHELLLRLKRERGIVSAFAHHARGGGLATRTGRGSFRFLESEVLTLMVAEEEAEAVFTFLFHAAGMHKPHGGMVLMERAQVGVPLSLPADVPHED